jgi:hypothetical protein
MRTGSPVASLPFMPGVNFLLQRPMPSRHVNFLPFSVDRPGNEDALIRGLADPRVRFMVLKHNMQVAPDPRANFGCYAPAATAYIAANFSKVDGVGSTWLMAKSGPGDPGFKPCPAPRNP